MDRRQRLFRELFVVEHFQGVAVRIVAEGAGSVVSIQIGKLEQRNLPLGMIGSVILHRFKLLAAVQARDQARIQAADSGALKQCGRRTVENRRNPVHLIERRIRFKAGFKHPQVFDRNPGEVGKLLQRESPLATQREQRLVERRKHVLRSGTDPGEHGVEFKDLRPVQRQHFADRVELLLVRHNLAVHHL